MVTVGVKRQVEHTPTASNGTVYTEAVQWQCTLIHGDTWKLNFSKNTLIVSVLYIIIIKFYGFMSLYSFSIVRLYIDKVFSVVRH